MNIMQTEIVIGESLLSPLKIYSLCNDGESFYAVAIFDRADVELAIGEMLRPNKHRRVCDVDEEELASYLTGWTANYTGHMGRSFAIEPIVKVFGGKVMVRQFRHHPLY